jgi:hypothetical protein
MRPHVGETRRRSRLALGRGYRGDRRDVRQILLDCLFSFGRRSGRLCGMHADNFLAGPPLLILDHRLRKMRKYDRAVAEIEVEAVVGGMLKRTLMPVLSVSRKCCPTTCRPALRKPPIPPLLPSAPLRRSSPSPSVDQARARGATARRQAALVAA